METTRTQIERSHASATGRILVGQPGASGALRRVAEADPGFAPAHAGLALLHHREGRVEAARRRLERAGRAASRATTRERSHVEALAAVVEGRAGEARRRITAHLRRWPGEALLVQEGAELLSWEAGADPRPARLAFLGALAPHYRNDPWFGGDYAFDLVESGDPVQARRLAREALQRNPRHAGAVHSLAHVLFEAEDARSGSRLLRSWLPGYCPRGAEHSHLTWHLALFELAQGRESEAMAVYRRGLDPRVLPQRRLWDCASFLWRRMLARPEAPLPWKPVRDLASLSASRSGSPFQDVHLAMAFAGAGDGAGMARLLRRLSAQAERGDAGAGEVALPLALGLAAFGRGAYREAAGRLEGAAGAVPRLGGSNAQRALFGATLAEAQQRAGRRAGQPR